MLFWPYVHSSDAYNDSLLQSGLEIKSGASNIIKQTFPARNAVPLGAVA